MANKRDKPLSRETREALSVYFDDSGIKEMEGLCIEYRMGGQWEGSAPSTSRAYLSRLNKALKHLDSLLGDASPDLGTYTGYDLVSFRRDVALVSGRVSRGLSSYKAPSGRKSNSAKWLVALSAARICEDHGIAVKNYCDGPYFKILEILFAECYPDSGSQSHRPYATKAIKYIKAHPMDWAVPTSYALCGARDEK